MPSCSRFSACTSRFCGSVLAGSLNRTPAATRSRPASVCTAQAAYFIAASSSAACAGSWASHSETFFANVSSSKVPPSLALSSDSSAAPSSFAASSGFTLFAARRWTNWRLIVCSGASSLWRAASALNSAWMPNSSARKSSRCGAISRISADSAFESRLGSARAASSWGLSAESAAPRWSRKAASSLARPSRSWSSAKDRPWASFSIPCLALQERELVLHVLPLVGVLGSGLGVGDDGPDLGELGVQRGEFLLLLGQVFLGKDRIHRAFGDAHGAIDALVRIDHQHVRPLVEAIHGAHVDAVGVFALDAAFRDDVGHRAILELAAHPRGSLESPKLYG